MRLHQRRTAHHLVLIFAGGLTSAFSLSIFFPKSLSLSLCKHKQTQLFSLNFLFDLILWAEQSSTVSGSFPGLGRWICSGDVGEE
jgi:hypothetical protein